MKNDHQKITMTTLKTNDLKSLPIPKERSHKRNPQWIGPLPKSLPMRLAGAAYAWKRNDRAHEIRP